MNTHKVTGADTDKSPSITGTAGGPFFLAWKQAGKDMKGEKILVSNSGDGIHWSAPTTIGAGATWTAKTDESLSLTIDGNGNLWAAWKGAEDDEIWYSWCPPPTTSPNWVQQQSYKDSRGVAPKTASGPSITGNDGVNPVVAWRKSDNTIWYAQIQSPLGAREGMIDPTPINEETGEELTVATSSTNWEAYLTFAWRKASDNTPSDNTLWYKTVLSGSEGGAAQQVQLTSGHSAVMSSNSPALASQPPGYLEEGSIIPGLAWRGTEHPNIWISNDFPGPPVTEQEVNGTTTGEPPLTDAAPALTGSGPFGVVAYKTAGDTTIYTFIAPG